MLVHFATLLGYIYVLNLLLIVTSFKPEPRFYFVHFVRFKTPRQGFISYILISHCWIQIHALDWSYSYLFCFVYPIVGRYMYS